MNVLKPLNELLKRNQEKLVGLHPVVQEKATELIKRAYKRNVELAITEGYRSFAEQQRLYNKGRTTSGSIVTNAKPGESYHNYGLAVDIALYKPNGYQLVWDVQRDLDQDGRSDWLEVVDEAKALGFKWGGDWRTFKDYPHFEYTFGLSIRDLLNGKRPPGNTVSSLLQQGDRGEAVQELQEQFKELGYTIGVDGIFGPQTEETVKKFQRSKQLTVDGIVGPMTTKALKDAIADKNQPPVVPYPGKLFRLENPYMRDRNGETYIQTIQKAVGAKADGVFGPKTESAVRVFQNQKGLVVDGVVGPKTWSLMF